MWSQFRDDWTKKNWKFLLFKKKCHFHFVNLWADGGPKYYSNLFPSTAIWLSSDPKYSRGNFCVLADFPSTVICSQVHLFVPKYSYSFPSTAKDRFCSADFPSTARDQFSWADFPSTGVKPQVQTQWMFVLIFLGNMLKIWTFPKMLFMTVFSFRSCIPNFIFFKSPQTLIQGVQWEHKTVISALALRNKFSRTLPYFLPTIGLLTLTR